MLSILRKIVKDSILLFAFKEDNTLTWAPIQKAQGKKQDQIEDLCCYPC